MLDLILVTLAAFTLLDYLLIRLGARSDVALIAASVFAVIVFVVKGGVL